MRRLLLALPLIFAVTMAAKPIATESSIALDTATPRLGEYVSFTTTVEKLAGWEYPMVDVQCYQDVNEDGYIDTTLLGPDVVFTWLEHPDYPILLGGGWSIWKDRGGGPAECVANLDAYGWKGGRQSIRILATTGTFLVEG